MARTKYTAQDWKESVLPPFPIAAMTAKRPSDIVESIIAVRHAQKGIEYRVTYWKSETYYRTYLEKAKVFQVRHQGEDDNHETKGTVAHPFLVAYERAISSYTHGLYTEQKGPEDFIVHSTFLSEDDNELIKNEEHNLETKCYARERARGPLSDHGYMLSNTQNHVHECRVFAGTRGCTRTQHPGAECLPNMGGVSPRVSTRVRVSASGPRVPAGRHPGEHSHFSEFFLHFFLGWKQPPSLGFTSVMSAPALDSGSASPDEETTLSRLLGNDSSCFRTSNEDDEEQQVVKPPATLNSVLEERGAVFRLPRHLQATWQICPPMRHHLLTNPSSSYTLLMSGTSCTASAPLAMAGGCGRRMKQHRVGVWDAEEGVGCGEAFSMELTTRSGAAWGLALLPPELVCGVVEHYQDLQNLVRWSLINRAWRVITQKELYNNLDFKSASNLEIIEDVIELMQQAVQSCPEIVDYIRRLSLSDYRQRFKTTDAAAVDFYIATVVPLLRKVNFVLVNAGGELLDNNFLPLRNLTVRDGIIDLTPWLEQLIDGGHLHPLENFVCIDDFTEPATIAAVNRVTTSAPHRRITLVWAFMSTMQPVFNVPRYNTLQELPCIGFDIAQFCPCGRGCWLNPAV
ncbi:hypothetical protein BDZ89DRAFT_1193278 [Hymenopellis radicata]|nr:hypothetical protein BDZ89DRAFT_1193278 [Hymenopellis radicata]